MARPRPPEGSRYGAGSAGLGPEEPAPLMAKVMDIEAGMQIVERNGHACMVGCGCLCFPLVLFLIVLISSIKVVEDYQQLVFKTSQGKTVKNGPFTSVVWPHQRMERREASRLGPRQFAVVKNERTGARRHVPGPVLLFLGAYEVKEDVRNKVVLQKNEYIRLVDTLSGSERIQRGPQTLVPEPLEEAPNGTQQAIIVGTHNAVVVFQRETGVKRLVTTPGMFIPAPYEEIQRVQQATLLEPNQFAVVKDTLTGVYRNELGPRLLQVGAYEAMQAVHNKTVLEKDEYVKLLDRRTGNERVLTGPQTIVPEPSEEMPEGKRTAVFLTTDTAVLVLNRTTGQKTLQTQQGVFIPGRYETVVEVRHKIRVLPHEAIAVRDALGQMMVRVGGGNGTGNAFFLEPYHQIVEMQWSDYSRQSQTTVPKVPVTKIDMRAQKMFFNYEVRTSDNVKLRLEGTIFWQVKDPARVVSMTDDPTGDVSQRARSSLIQQVSKVPFSTFMAGFSNITESAYDGQRADSFYSERGVELQSMEITRFDCVDQETAQVLQQIIQETTNRINQLQIAESQNEVRSAKLRADIELERQRTELIQTKAFNTRLEAENTGKADGALLAESVSTFIDGLNSSLPNLTSRLDLYRMHESIKSRNKDTHNLASGKATLFLTPEDLNLKLNMGGGGASSGTEL